MKFKRITPEELNEIVKGFAYTASKAEPQWWRREYMKIADAQLQACQQQVDEAGLTDEGLRDRIIKYLLVQTRLEDWPSGRVRVAYYDDTDMPRQADELISLFHEYQMKREKEVAREIAAYIRMLPTDGFDKWYSYQQEIAVKIEAKYLGEQEAKGNE